MYSMPGLSREDRRNNVLQNNFAFLEPENESSCVSFLLVFQTRLLEIVVFYLVSWSMDRNTNSSVSVNKTD